ncbi:MAG: LamG domain-containing protein, partial [Sediminibacterium sp.]|nr:LamG domain-containing protein [Sediminibacterium sp.]
TGLKATANYTSNFIGRSNDNTATTLGNWQDFRVWNRSRTPQEIKNYFKSRIIKYEDSLIYNLLLNGKYTSSVDYLANGAKLPNDAISKEAIIDSAIITSANNTGARFVFDSTNQQLYGTIANVLSAGDSIQISNDNGITWVSVDTVVQNTWVATLPISFTAGTIRIRSKLVNRNFSNFVIKIKPSYFTYTPNEYANLEGVIDSTNLPSIRSSTPTNYVLKTNKNGYSINNTTGRINWNNTILTSRDTLFVTAKNDIDSISTNVIVHIGDSIQSFNYSVDTLNIQYYTMDSSALPIITGSGAKTYSIIAGATAGISINANTGVIYVANTASIGTYNLTIQGRSNLNSKITNLIIKVLPNIPIFSYPDTFYTVYYNNIGSSNNAIVNKTGITNRFNIISGNNIHIIIDSITGEINNLPKLYIGTYNLQVELSNAVGADTINYTIIIEEYKDTIHGFYNSAISTSTNAQARSGDYIALPTLDLKNTSYTIETWFKYNGTDPVNSFIRIFDFNIYNPPTGAGVTNILLCFANGSTITNPTLKVFAGKGENTVNVPANNQVNISNWNHYALVYNIGATTASLYINGVLISSSILADKSRYDFLSSFIGASTDNSNSTIGSFKAVKIWKRALSAQELNVEFQPITNTFKYKLYYYLPLERFNKTSQHIINNTQLNNASTAIGANPNNAIIKSIGDTGAKYLIDANNNIVFGNIKDTLNYKEFIQVKINDENGWNNATVINNNWYYKTNINTDVYQITVRGYDSLNEIVTRTFNTLYIDNKIKNIIYGDNPKTISYKTAAVSVQPTFTSSSAVKFKLINNPFLNSISIDTNFGFIRVGNNVPVGLHIIPVQAYSLYDTVIINYSIHIVAIKPSGLNYPNNIVTYYANLINATPTLNETGGVNVKYTMINAPSGFIIDTNTGVITTTNDVQIGVYKIQVNVTNEVGYDSNFLNIELRSLKDSIFGFIASTTQLTTNAVFNNGDKIILPTLNLDSSYTVETWFKLDSNTGTNYPFIYAFGGWNNGLIFNNQGGNNRSLIVKSWGAEANTPANLATGITILPNVWNHYTVVVNGRNTKVYLNGELRREYVALGTPTNNNVFNNNKIGTGEALNISLSTTLGLFKEFKIWKKARTAAEIRTNFTNQHIIFDTNLYYFLPLSNPNSNISV